MSFFANLEDDAKALVERIVSEFEALELEAIPYVKEFFSLLISQEGKDAISAGLAAIPDFLIGNVGAGLEAILAAVESTIGANAANDAQVVLGQAEAASVSASDSATFSDSSTDSATSSDSSTDSESASSE